MKTPEQIKAWLEAQPWYEQFKERVMSGDDISDKSKKDILDGKRSIYTLTEGIPELADMDIHPADASASVAVHRGRGERVRPE